MTQEESRLKEFGKIKLYYESALKQLQTELNLINDEFSTLSEIQPIDHIKTRIKSFSSLYEKMNRKNIDFTIENTFLLCDIVGARIVCNFVDDIYSVINKIKSKGSLKIIEEKDYIKNPKRSGYRGYHIIVQIPVVINEIKRDIKCEIQIRSTAMDFWASSEHKLNYKSTCMSDKDKKELKKLADDIWKMDQIMNKLSIKRKQSNLLESKQATDINLLSRLFTKNMENKVY